MRPYSDWRSGGGRVERQLEASLRKVIAFLDARGFRYAVIGV